MKQKDSSYKWKNWKILISHYNLFLSLLLEIGANVNKREIGISSQMAINYGLELLFDLKISIMKINGTKKLLDNISQDVMGKGTACKTVIYDYVSIFW